MLARVWSRQLRVVDASRLVGRIIGRRSRVEPLSRARGVRVEARQRGASFASRLRGEFRQQVLALAREMYRGAVEGR